MVPGTTFARQFLPAAGIREFLNAGSIAAGLSPLDPPAGRIRAARGCYWRAGGNLSRTGDDFAFESTISGRTYATMFREAKTRGYTIHLCYLSLESVQISIRRVRERVRKGGHDVPLEDLKRRFLPSLESAQGSFLRPHQHSQLLLFQLAPSFFFSQRHQQALLVCWRL